MDIRNIQPIYIYIFVYQCLLVSTIFAEYEHFYYIYIILLYYYYILLLYIYI